MARQAAKPKGERAPTDRMKKAASLINGGKPVDKAMLEAGYGPGFVAGMAGQFPDVLAGVGLLSPRAAGGSTIRARPAVAEPATTEEVTA